MTRRKARCITDPPGDLHDSLGWPELEGPAMALLEAISASCSINRAAKIVGMSYKSAWEHVETLNNLEVMLQLAGGNTVTAIITRESVRRLELVQWVKACAVIKASSVLLAVV